MRVRTASAVLVAMCIAQGASAADLPLAPKFYDWTGVYVGANLGYGSAGVTAAGSTSSQSISGAVAGGQVGANLQFGAFVVGAEIDAEWSGLQSAATGTTVDFKIPWLATARLRIGFAHDRIHYYLTGGAGYMQFSRADASGVFLSTTSQARTAWVIGAGSESAINRNLILRFEVLYLRLLGNADALFGTATTTTAESGYDVIGRVGLSYKFGWSNSQGAIAAARKIYDWTGVYVGANLGYGSAGVTAAGTTSTQSISGAIAGGQVGVNWQFGAFVVGAEIDAEWSGLQSAASGTTVDFNIPWLTTARLRIGFAHDRFHYYATGGAGYAQFSRTDPNGVLLTSTSQARTAWVIGAGGEYAMNRNLILRGEVLYLGLLGTTDNLFGTATTTAGTTTATTESGYDIIGRVGLSYKFGWSN